MSNNNSGITNKTCAKYEVEIERRADHQHPIPKKLDALIEKTISDADCTPGYWRVIMADATKGTAHTPKFKAIGVSPGGDNGSNVEIIAKPRSNKSARRCFLYPPDGNAQKAFDQLSRYLSGNIKDLPKEDPIIMNDFRHARQLIREKLQRLQDVLDIIENQTQGRFETLKRRFDDDRAKIERDGEEEKKPIFVEIEELKGELEDLKSLGLDGPKPAS